MNKTIEELVELVIKWSSDRKILQNGKIESQTLKLISETGELADNTVIGKCIKDDIGDILVLLTNITYITNKYNINDFVKNLTSDKQCIHIDNLKLVDEVLLFDYKKGNLAKNIIYGNETQIFNSIKDLIPNLINITKLSNTNLIECLNISYNNIKDRKGITSNGCFVKDNE